MPSEVRKLKLVGNFRRPINQVSADPDYNPANPLFDYCGARSGRFAIKNFAPS